jgi:hypothetical protein
VLIADPIIAVRLRGIALRRSKYRSKATNNRGQAANSRGKAANNCGARVRVICTPRRPCCSGPAADAGGPVPGGDGLVVSAQAIHCDSCADAVRCDFAPFASARARACVRQRLHDVVGWKLGYRASTGPTHACTEGGPREHSAFGRGQGMMVCHYPSLVFENLHFGKFKPTNFVNQPKKKDPEWRSS